MLGASGSAAVDNDSVSQRLTFLRFAIFSSANLLTLTTQVLLRHLHQPADWKILARIIIMLIKYTKTTTAYGGLWFMNHEWWYTWLHQCESIWLVVDIWCACGGLKFNGDAEEVIYTIVLLCLLWRKAHTHTCVLCIHNTLYFRLM